MAESFIDEVVLRVIVTPDHRTWCGPTTNSVSWVFENGDVIHIPFDQGGNCNGYIGRLFFSGHYTGIICPPNFQFGPIVCYPEGSGNILNYLGPGAACPDPPGIPPDYGFQPGFGIPFTSCNPPHSWKRFILSQCFSFGGSSPFSISGVLRMTTSVIEDVAVGRVDIQAPPYPFAFHWMPITCKLSTYPPTGNISGQQPIIPRLPPEALPLAGVCCTDVGEPPPPPTGAFRDAALLFRLRDPVEPASTARVHVEWIGR